MAMDLPEKPPANLFTQSAKWLMVNCVLFNGARPQAAELLSNINWQQGQRAADRGDRVQEKITNHIFDGNVEVLVSGQSDYPFKQPLDSVCIFESTGTQLLFILYTHAKLLLNEHKVHGLKKNDLLCSFYKLKKN